MKTRMTMIVAAAVVLHCVTSAQAYLHPQMGRFMQRDPAGYVDGSNLHEYQRSAPTNKLDSTGLQTSAPSTTAASPTLEFDRDHQIEDCKCPCTVGRCDIKVTFVAPPGSVRIHRTSRNTGSRTFTDRIAVPDRWNHVSVLFAVELYSLDGDDVTGCHLHQWVVDRHFKSNGRFVGDQGLKTEIDYPFDDPKKGISTAVFYGGFFYVDQPHRTINSDPAKEWWSEGFWQAKVTLEEDPDFERYLGWSFDWRGLTGSATTTPPGKTTWGPEMTPRPNPFAPAPAAPTQPVPPTQPAPRPGR